MKIYPINSFEKFGFTDILNETVKYADNFYGKQKVLNTSPSDDTNIVISTIEETQQQLLLLREVGNVSFYIPEITKSIHKLKISNVVLTKEEVLLFHKIAVKFKSVFTYYATNKEFAPQLYKIIKDVEIPEGFSSHFEEFLLIPPGTIKDNATDRLFDIRKKLRNTRVKLAKIYQGVISKYSKDGWLVDFNESYVNDRRVLAVKSEKKNMINGIIHGYSDSGKTTYIEPARTVEHNNEISSLEREEKKEEYKVLSIITSTLVYHKEVYEECIDMIGYFDCLNAKATFANKINAVVPNIKKRDLKIIDGYHPLLLLQSLNKKEVVPLNFMLNDKHRIAVISGPNAGGKTIALKTVSLYQLMLQSGFLLPVNEQSNFPVFKSLLSDIGDDQSIEAELSTYSSRLKKMKYFLENVDENSLLIIDEFGTGSDPELGGAMAEVILEDLAISKAFGVVTTHYSNLKVMGDKTMGIQNCHMMFDKKTLSPLYNLVQGLPGSSYTFEVAQNIGVSYEVIERAKAKMENVKVNLDKILVDVQNEKQELDQLKLMYDDQLIQLKRSKQSYTDKVNILESKIEKQNFKLNENQREIDLGIKFQALLNRVLKGDKIKDVLKSIEQYFVAEKKKLEIKKEKKDTLKKNNKVNKEETIEFLRKKIIPGAFVKLKSNKEVGEVITVNNDKVVVAFGLLKMTAKLTDLRVVFKRKKN